MRFLAFLLGVGGLALRAEARAPLPKLLVLRGGVKPAVVSNPATPAKAAQATLDELEEAPPELALDPATPPSRSAAQKRRAKKARSVPSLGRDAATAALCLSAVGAAQITSEPFMAAVPGSMKAIGWLIYGASFSSFLFALVRIFNYERAAVLNRLLSALLFGDSDGTPSSGPAFAVFAAIGGAASMQSLPASAG